MRPERDYLGLPIRSLQTMLRTLSRCAPGLPCPIPDGVFGEVTLEAVMRFQQSAGMPITGRVDNDTWDAIAAAYRSALPSVMPPRPVRAFREQAFEVRAGQCCVHMCLVQAMFLALSQVIEEIEPAPVNALHTGASVRNVIWLQGRAGLPETGTMEKQTHGSTMFFSTAIFTEHCVPQPLRRPQAVPSSPGAASPGNPSNREAPVYK